MEKTAFLVGGKKGVEIFAEFYELAAPTIMVKAVFANDSGLWGVPVFEGLRIQRPADIADCQSDSLIVCAEPVLCEALVQTLREKLGAAADAVIPYYEWLRFNIGAHQIDWKKIYGLPDLTAALQECGTLNDCEKFYYNKPHRVVEKYAHYFEVYDRHFQKYRNTECVIVEIGVFKGGSLQMWKDYFGDRAQVVGIDIEESTMEYAEERIAIEIGSQSDRQFWRKFKEKYPKVDVLIDDGGHTMEQQIVTFEEMFDHIAEDGVYLIEDLHTSYMERFGGGYKNPGSFIEYSKNFIDYINAWYNIRMAENRYTRAMQSLHYYDSILVVEKRKMYRSVCMHTGE